MLKTFTLIPDFMDILYSVRAEIKYKKLSFGEWDTCTYESGGIWKKGVVFFLKEDIGRGWRVPTEIDTTIFVAGT
jgi:hypothetical protein